MIQFGASLARQLQLPATIELLGDLGVGKTTLVKGLAKALNIQEAVTSPSFTISNTYVGQLDTRPVTLRHYDFYRLQDPGILSQEIEESVQQPNTLTVVEWGESLANVLPKNRLRIIIRYLEDGQREVELKT